MKAYGIPRIKASDNYPDCVDAKVLGRASHYTRLPGKSGDIRASQKSKKKNATRRYWKKSERANVKKNIKSELE